jgi:hypothetical protein
MPATPTWQAIISHDVHPHSRAQYIYDAAQSTKEQQTTSKTDDRKTGAISGNQHSHHAT